MHDTSEIAKLIRKKLDGTITARESAVLHSWLQTHDFGSALRKDITTEEAVLEDVLRWLELQDRDKQEQWSERLTRMTAQKIANDSPITRPRMGHIRRILTYAAVFLVISALTLIVYRNHVDDLGQVVVQDLVPGSNKALITLSDGRVIELSEDQEGVILGQELTYGDGTLIAQLNDAQVVDATIETPRGGQYQITLPDGTKVWLNAETKLTYPSRFAVEERRVELAGEAYFDVAGLVVEGERVPFVVKTAQHEIEVLGTAFNVTAYEDDVDSRTTLVEGSVRLLSEEGEVFLNPGEQARCDMKGLSKSKVDVAPYIAWKDNEFVFDETELKDALKILSRWYDFDLNMNNVFPKTHLYGSISRTKNLTEVLKIMESSGLKFKIEKSAGRNNLTIQYE